MVVDQTTPALGLPLPHSKNKISDDVERIRLALAKLDTSAGEQAKLLATKADAKSIIDALSQKTGTKEHTALEARIAPLEKAVGEIAVDSGPGRIPMAGPDGKLAPGWCSPLISTATLATTWVGDTPPYTQTLTISGVTGSSVVEITLPSTATAEEITAYQALQWTDGGQAKGEVTLKAWGEKNGIDIPVTVIVRG